MTVNGIPVASGSASNSIPLTVGVNPITTTVTAQDGTTTKIYTLNVTRLPSNNADLSSLGLSDGTLSPAFEPNTIAYTASVPNATESFTITPTLAQIDATVIINGIPATSGSASNSIPLFVGVNPITTTVTAQDGTTTKTYTLNVTRLPSNNADLAILGLSDGTLSPAFEPNTIAYTASVSNATESFTITPTLAQINATVTVNGIPATSGSASNSIPLSVGVNPITTTVTAQDGTTTKTYTLNVTRAPLPFGQWQFSYFGSSDSPDANPGADPDMDGVANLLEYVLGGVPIGPGASDTSILPTCVKTETSLVFKFHRTKTATQEFSTVIESSSILMPNDWTPVSNENVTVESIGSTSELVTATIPLAPSAGKLFVRLRVQTNP